MQYSNILYRCRFSIVIYVYVKSYSEIELGIHKLQYKLQDTETLHSLIEIKYFPSKSLYSNDLIIRVCMFYIYLYTITII